MSPRLVERQSTDDDGYRDALDFLYGRLNYERTDSIPYDSADMRLDRMRRLLELLGDPQNDAPIVHVAGTKGKGSTSHFLSSILSHAGYRTGCYTSPHLTRLEERFAIDGQPCTPHDIVHWVDCLRPIVRQMDDEAAGDSLDGPTFFELATAIAYLHFRGASADFIVLEVGLGGRLDSTNVCNPRVCVITSISFDHMRQLGHTLGEIAGEKAGIIKPNVPVVTGVTDEEPWLVIDRMANDLRAPVFRLERDFSFVYHAPNAADTNESPRMDYFHLTDGRSDCVARQVALSALGAHQAANAALAWATCESLMNQGFVIPESAIQDGLAKSRCPARIEVLRRKPTVVVDTAHNAASIEALVRVLRESFPLRPRVLILAATQGKDVDGMLLALVPEFETIICTQYLMNPRGMPVDELVRHARRMATAQGNVVDLIDCPSPRDAWLRATAEPDQPGLICATGSFFLAAEMKTLLSEFIRETPVENGP